MQNYIYQDNQSLDSRVSAVMRSVYLKMFVALLITTVSSFIICMIPNLTYYLASHVGLYWGLLIVELIMVFAISGGIKSISSTTASILFYLYAILNGVVFALIFCAYSFDSIFKTFLITAGTFGAMSAYGYFTKCDLARLGSFLRMALIGLIIMIVVNIFWANSTLDWIISFVGLAIFIGLSAADTQKIKGWIASGQSDLSRVKTVGALTLYLDFINLFLYLLRFFGNSRD
ncbi:MAG: Bax inhibitor-1/YccA family protein [Muribaculum sp.]|nr:Bax inhibitor-1/YccA family protein [Muribaculaceae bacterium]MCM1080775.1 Bax inhibitor-1/YccA family protein [Muribaculum sp.]